MSLLYVDPDGRVSSGRLVTDEAERGESVSALLSRTGDLLGPTDVRALLAPRTPTDDQRAALWHAHRSGFRVETG